jgi:Family of unknown function (DUF6011)
MSNTDLNDSLDDLLGGATSAVRVEPVRAPADYQPRAFDEVCAKCRGTGNTRWGMCFRCKGAGKKTFKTSPQVRQAGREASQVRRDRAPVNNWEGFKALHPEAAGWILSKPNFEFAVSLKASVERFGELTEKQLAACQRCIESDRARAAERHARDQSAPEVVSAGVDRLKLAFDTAIAYTKAKGRGRNLKWPKITLGDVVISPAKEGSQNPGALYVKMAGKYLGKIVNGRFFAVGECSTDQQAKVVAFIADPKAAAEAYGIETGTCCICNATLTNRVSIERGIGPICGEKFGW